MICDELADVSGYAMAIIGVVARFFHTKGL
jgi:hypothetical protein